MPTAVVDPVPASPGVNGYTPDALIPAPAPLGARLSPVVSASFVAAAPVGTPAWYFRRLMAKLDARAGKLAVWDAYYRGDQPLAFASEKFREAFGGRFRAFCSNFTALVVDGTRERMEVTGFDFGGKRVTERAWKLWQQNDMDGASLIAHTEALIKGVSYVLVQPGSGGEPPRLTIEDAFDAITEPDPADTRKRRAGLKRWIDDDGHLVAFLYLPDEVWKLRSIRPWAAEGDRAAGWEPWPSPGEPWPARNPLGVVPLVPLVNRPRLRGDGVSEVDPVMSNQDAINKYRADALVAAEFAAFRQRWATGLEVPTDPVTGQPVEPFKAAVDRLWVAPPPDPEDPNPVETRFGEFGQTDLAPYARMIEGEVAAMSSISRLPYHYLLGQPQSVPPSGESLKSSEAGLVAKVRTAEVHFGEGWEEALRIALVASGDRSAMDRSAETKWRDPETRNEGVRTDATVKAYTSDIIDRNEARVALGYQPVDDPEPAPAPEPPPVPDPGSPAEVPVVVPVATAPQPPAAPNAARG